MRRKFNIAARKLEIRQTNSVGNGNHTALKSKRKKKTPPVYGIFVKAGQTIEKDEFIGEYLGKIVKSGFEGPSLWSDYVYTLDEGDNRWESDAKERLYSVEIDSQYVGNWTRFMNHHCSPNVDAMDTQAGKIRMMAFQANRKIEANEEVFINYGTYYFSGRGWQCRCPQHPEPHTPARV
ncbi:hypothetical protein QBC43DRAFT_270845 [Cladorrhinum sp. PSN259]|nr:hypothetical protein QBC43DRAFT_270845 [Cladorrhinum sp. PSN259]